uniref:SCAN box domain-containing protein n=1 Tax=Pygocentrus nattereri TaxID=42514 RepID=A0AAR2JZ42_PYGNA
HRADPTPSSPGCPTLREFDRPFVLPQQLRDSCRRWLLSEERDSEEVLDLVVLEQFITRLPEETAAWVQCHQPESLDKATELAHMAAYSGAGAPTQETSLSPSLSPYSCSPKKGSSSP